MTTKINCLNDGFVQLIDHMGSDSSICNAARVSYGNHNNQLEVKAWTQVAEPSKNVTRVARSWERARIRVWYEDGSFDNFYESEEPSVIDHYDEVLKQLESSQKDKDRSLIRYLMRHRHTTPFEMVSFVFLVRAPIHVARQWFRHRTWSYNEYSTRYKPAIDSFETTDPDKWRTQATNNKQGSEGTLSDWEDLCLEEDSPIKQKYKEMIEVSCPPGEVLTAIESQHHIDIKSIYQERLELRVAREQARKDLPLSTYTEFYAKVDLHNLFHFLSLRLDGHAQLEIRTYAEAISQLIKPIVPISYQAFEDYRLNGCGFSSQEMEMLRHLIQEGEMRGLEKPDSLSTREWNEFKEKLQ